MTHFTLTTALATASLVAFAGYATACTGVEDNAPEISATYVDETGQFHAVGADGWLSFGLGDQLVFFVCSVDNDKNYLTAQNGPANDVDYDLYSRFEWFTEGDNLFYCHQVSDAGSQADAEDFSHRPAANATDPTLEGCGPGNHPWSKLSIVRL